MNKKQILDALGIIDNTTTIDFLLTFLQVQGKFPKVAVLDPRKGEKAVLVKDYEGDYALIIGRWAVYKNKREVNSACE